MLFYVPVHAVSVNTTIFAYISLYSITVLKILKKPLLNTFEVENKVAR